LLPQTGAVAGMAGLAAVGGSALLTSGFALATKKRKGTDTPEVALDQMYNDEYGKMFSNND